MVCSSPVWCWSSSRSPGPLSTSLKNPGDIFLFPPTWIPNPIRWENYVEAMTKADFGRYFLNTTIITLVDIVAKVMSCSLVAFAFARLRWWGRDVLFMVMLSTLMLPQQVTLIPQFIIYRQLGWIDTFLPLIVPNLFGGPFFTFLLRQFFLSIPTDLDDAARIDGCSSWGVYWRIILPLSRPALMMVAIYVFNITWNDFFGPLIYLHNRNNYTISLGLQAFQTQAGTRMAPDHGGVARRDAAGDHSLLLRTAVLHSRGGVQRRQGVT